MKNPTHLECTSCGWRRSLTNAGRTEFARAVEQAIVAAGHVLAAGLADPARLHRVIPVTTVTVDITLDSSQFLAALDGAARAGYRLAADLEGMRWSNVKRAQRNQARKDWMAQAEAMYTRYGWEWPGPVPGTAWARRRS